MTPSSDPSPPATPPPLTCATCGGPIGGCSASSGPPPRRWRAPKVLVAVALVAVGALVGSSVAVASHQFSDVPDTNPFHDDIGWAAENGIVNGYGNGTYGPGNGVTRQAMAAMLRRLAGAAPGVDPVVTADGIEVFREGGDDTVITATSSLSAQEVATVSVESAGLYLVFVTGEVYTQQDEASVSCYLGDTGAIRAMLFYTDLDEIFRYRQPVTGFGIIDEGASAEFTVRCHKFGTQGAGDTSINALNVVAVKIADQPPRRGG